MTHTYRTLLPAVFLSLFIHPADAEEVPWTTVPTDLSDWSDPGRWWKVRDDVFIAETKGGKSLPRVHYLVWNGVTGRDFELSLEYRISAKQPRDAGVNFRVERPFPAGRPNLPGYQAELDTAFLYSKQPRIREGKLFGNIHDGKRSHMFKRSTRTVIAGDGRMTTKPLADRFDPHSVFRKPPEWNHCLVRAEGEHIELSLNGVRANVIIDQDPKNRSTGQSIALQFRPVAACRFEVRNLKYRPVESPSDSIPDSTPSAVTRDSAVRLAETGKLAEAADAFERLFQSRPDELDTLTGLWLATLYASTGDRARHEAFCKRFFESFSKWKKPTEAARPAKAYLLFPEAADSALLQRADSGTRHAMKTGRGRIRIWFELSRGMAQYRLGKYAAARRSLNRPIQSRNPLQQIPAQAFAAMSEFRQDNIPEAKRLLSQANDGLSKLDRSKSAWNDVLGAQLAVDEAKQLID